MVNLQNMQVIYCGTMTAKIGYYVVPCHIETTLIEGKVYLPLRELEHICVSRNDSISVIEEMKSYLRFKE